MEQDFRSGVMEELDTRVGSSASAHIRRNDARQLTGHTRRKDRADRATTETVLDSRTWKNLEKLGNVGTFQQLHGCISTGKEANVYSASTAEGETVAVKIYKTSILVFKDRDRYVSGDYRFRKAYSRSNPRKMVKMWAEKEMRNLTRIKRAGILAPAPLAIRDHVLVMQFIGTAGIAAPRLKDARPSDYIWQSLYEEAVLLIRRLYQECRLVHADLSEYNLLVHEERLVVIDVSQSVDLDHPQALQFLREDALHINTFFGSRVPTLTTREVFEFAVDPSITANNQPQAVQGLREAAASRSPAERAALEERDVVFAQAYIPRRLEEVVDHEADHLRLQQGGDTDGIYYQVIAGMSADMSGARLQPRICEQLAQQRGPEAAGEASSASSSEADSEEGDEGSASSSGEAEDLPLHEALSQQLGPSAAGAPTSPVRLRPDGSHPEPGDSSASSSDEDADSREAGSDLEDLGKTGKRPNPPSLKNLSKEDRKAHKEAVKEDKRERRKHKMPKKVKKKLVNKHKH